MSTFVLIDGNSLLHRAYHALPSLTIPGGQPTGAVYGFASMLIKVLDELEPEYLAVAFDTKEPTFRHKMYVEYKAHRPKMDEELVSQVNLVKDVVDAFGFPRFEVPGYEADDIIATIVSNIRNSDIRTFQEDMEIVIVSGDLDLLQLVDEHVRVYTSRKGLSDTIVYDAQAVEERYGLPPEKLRDYKALVGDSSDNIPGVKGIGPKSAAQLLSDYDSLKGVYKHIDSIPDKWGARLGSQRGQAFMSRDLVGLETSVPVNFDSKNCEVREVAQKEVKGFSHVCVLNHYLKDCRVRGKKEEQGSLFA